MDFISIDGSYLEGGGQILRTSLSLSALLQKPVRISRIRAGRSNPGLQLQHLTAVKAAAEICDAAVKGASLGSQEVHFSPSQVKGGDYDFDIGSAGSTTLVLQTILPPLLFASADSRVKITGGTSNPFAPSGFFMQKAFAPALAKFGGRVSVDVKRWGWFPQGAGVLESTIKPVESLKPIAPEATNPHPKIRGHSIVSNLPLEIAERMKAKALRELADMGQSDAKIELLNAPSIGIGAELFLLAESNGLANGFSALGEKSKPAHKVAGEAVHALKVFLEAGTTLEEHLADQLLLYAALAKGESSFTVSRVDRHLITNAWVLRQFLPECEIELRGNEGEKGEVKVSGTGFTRLPE